MEQHNFYFNMGKYIYKWVIFHSNLLVHWKVIHVNHHNLRPVVAFGSGFLGLLRVKGHV